MIAPNAVRPQIVKKITGPRVTGMDSHEIADLGRTKRTTLYHVAGTATAIFSGESKYGEYFGINGEFIATPDGGTAKFMSGTCYMPAVAHDLVAGGLGPNPEPGKSIQFAYTIGVQPDKNSPVGFSYWAESLTPPKPDDTLNQLTSYFPTGAPAIENGTKKGK